jgi:hypothetical protein
MRRVLLGFGLLAGTLAFLAFFGAHASPAYANQRDKLVVDGNKGATEADYPALIGNYPASQAANPEPADCSDPSSPYCDAIPLDIQPPSGLTVFDTWFAYIAVSWDKSQPGGCADLGGVTDDCNDVDIYTYDNKQIDTAHTSYTDTGDSASSDDPEVAKLFQPGLGVYNLIVNNFAGVNKGYHLKVTFEVFKGEKPFELLAPSPSLGDNSTPTPSDSGGANASGSSSSGAPPVDYGVAGPALAPAPIETDAAFNDFPIPEDQFRAPAKGETLLPNLIAAQAKPPKPASGLLILLTMVLIPLLFIGGGVGWAYKRSRAAFNL